MKDLSGKMFGRLMALEPIGMSRYSGTIWNCLCICGENKQVTIGNLNSGHVKSCGCLSVESRKTRGSLEGKSNSPEYKSWTKMKERMFDKNCKDYPNYGGKNLGFETTWLDFNIFYAYIGNKPNDGKRYSLNRFDNTLGYIIGNVEWADDNTQARNKTFQNNNTSGKSGVVWDRKVHPNGRDVTIYANAIWSDIETGKQRKKCFSTKTYGVLPAFAMACIFRENKLIELNMNGAGYSDKHGL